MAGQPNIARRSCQLAAVAKRIASGRHGSTRTRRRQAPGRARSGKVLVMVAVCLPAILAIVGLVYDSGFLLISRESIQHSADAGATAAAMDLLLGNSNGTAVADAATYVQGLNNLAAAQVTTNIPPQSGAYAGQTGFVEVLTSIQYQTQFMQMLGAAPQSQVVARAVAGYEPSTANGAVVVLDPSPAPVSIGPITAIELPSYPALIGGLEVLGLGNLTVNGAVLVNNTWGGVDQDGNPAGTGSGPPYGIACTPLLSTSQLLATNIRVVGGVDNQKNYGSATQGQPSPLRANAIPVPDPFENLPTPCTATDPANVVSTNYGGVQVVELPLIGPTTTLSPGVYNWIEIDSGTVVFSPGIYIICSVNPTTGIGLNILGGTVTANGVLFYITNSTSFNATSGAPDNADGDTRPATASVTEVPSVVINAALPGSSFSPLATASSPFAGMLFYQRRQDYRPIVIYSGLPTSTVFQGIVYAKWAQFLFGGSGTLNLSVASGTARFVMIGGVTVTPTNPLPPAQDVFLVE